MKKCVTTRWPEVGPVRKNLELSIALRNKVEHRYHEVITLATTGYAQALLLNYEDELTSSFGSDRSLGEQLRFPIFVGTLTGLGQARMEELRGSLPRTTRDFLARFEADLDPAISEDQRYQFRVTLHPRTGPRGQADAAYTFVREADLTPQEKEKMAAEGKAGKVLIREQTRSVTGAGKVRPGSVAELVEEQIAYKFQVHHVVRAWKKLACRPPSGSSTPERTDDRYCEYDEPHRDYLYKPAFIARLAKLASTEDGFLSLTGLTPIAKVTE